MNEKNDFAVTQRPTRTLEKSRPGVRRMLTLMVTETLELAKTQYPSPSTVIAATRVESWFENGVKYYFGRGVPRDYAEGVKWFRKAAEQNHAKAQYNLGKCHTRGEGVERDYTEAVKWFRKAAEQNSARAQSDLGVCYDNGQGVEKDFAEAVKWYRKSAEQNYAEAQYNLGICYGFGKGVLKDYAEAVQWLNKAAAQGIDRAKELLLSLQK